MCEDVEHQRQLAEIRKLMSRYAATPPRPIPEVLRQQAQRILARLRERRD